MSVCERSSNNIDVFTYVVSSFMFHKNSKNKFELDSDKSILSFDSYDDFDDKLLEKEIKRSKYNENAPVRSWYKHYYKFWT